MQPVSPSARLTQFAEVSFWICDVSAFCTSNTGTSASASFPGSSPAAIFRHSSPVSSPQQPEASARTTPPWRARASRPIPTRSVSEGSPFRPPGPEAPVLLREPRVEVTTVPPQRTLPSAQRGRDHIARGVSPELRREPRVEHQNLPASRAVGGHAPGAAQSPDAPVLMCALCCHRRRSPVASRGLRPTPMISPLRALGRREGAGCCLLGACALSFMIPPPTGAQNLDRSRAKQRTSRSASEAPSFVIARFSWRPQTKTLRTPEVQRAPLPRTIFNSPDSCA